MVGIHQNDLVVFVNTILVDPVRVQYPQVSASFAHTLLSSTPETPLELEVIHTLADGLAIGSTYTSKI